MEINRSHSYRTSERSSHNYYPILQQNVGCDFHAIRAENCDHIAQMNINIRLVGRAVVFYLTGPYFSSGTGRVIIIVKL